MWISGKQRRADREVVVARASSVDQLARVLQAAVGVATHSVLALRRVAAQREHVLDAGVAHLVERLAQLARVVAPTQVKCAIASSPWSRLDATDDLDRLVARRAAGAVGDRDEVGLERRAARASAR